ncbi:MAG: T9SS type A sorting domain-containing protein [Bacteroidales bacterium]|nr:T9SS type A sorting domain-containing protein [Bacteroidales bacterium]
MKRVFLLFFSIFYSTFLSSLFAQNKQSNTVGSEYFADAPYRIEVSQMSSLPISFYFHENECFGCSGDLAFIDVEMKNSSDANFTKLIFNHYSDSAFLALFSEKSIMDNVWNSQSFDQSLPLKNANRTIIFTSDTNVWIPPVPNVPLKGRYFYFNFNLPFDVWSSYLGSSGVIDIKISLGIDFEVNQYFYLRVFTSNYEYPKLSDWYRGDTHYHSFFTQNLAENGLPLSQVKKAAHHAGLQWITATDHSCDFDNYGNSMADNWERLGNMIHSLNTEDSSFCFIRGIEMSINNSDNKVVHALCYPNPNLPFSLPYIGDGGGDASSTSINAEMMLDSLKKYQAFCYAAHPFAEFDKLASAIGGGIWNLGHSDFPINNELHPSMGTVICNDLNIPSDVLSQNAAFLFKENLIGGQVWNLWNALFTSSNLTEDPFNIQNPSGNAMSELDSTRYESHIYRLNQNMDVYKTMLKLGLKAKNTNPQIQNWKSFLLGGSDSHGSFNYSTTDMFNGITGNITDNAIGKISTLVYCPNGMGVLGENVLSALKKGNTVMSSGPIVVPEIVLNGQILAIPGNDIEMNFSEFVNTQLKIKYNNSAEFGNPSFLKLIIGTETSEFVYLVNNYSPVQNINLLNIITHLQISPDNYMDTHFYVRVEFESQKTFDNIQVYRTTNNVYHCFSNPIWIKVRNNTEIEVVDKKVVISPNPAVDVVHIYSESKIQKIEIIHLDSKFCQTFMIQNSNYETIDVKYFPKGIYLFKIQTLNGQIVKKIIVQ